MVGRFIPIPAPAIFFVLIAYIIAVDLLLYAPVLIFIISNAVIVAILTGFYTPVSSLTIMKFSSSYIHKEAGSQCN